MRVKASLLASRGEERLHRALHASFAGTGGRFLPQVTFSELIDASREEIRSLAHDLVDPFGWYLQTSVDLTFVLDGSMAPLFSIEYDGLGGGFSRDGSYVASSDSAKDPRRRQKLDLKIKMARAASYPLVVLASDELRPLGEKEARVIAEGIASRLLVHSQYEVERRRIARREGIDLASAGPDELNWLSYQAEVEADRQYDPLSRATQAIVDDLSLEGVTEETVQQLYRPPVPDPSEDAQAWKAALESADEVGASVSVQFDGHRVHETIWMRNLVLPVDRRTLPAGAEAFVQAVGGVLSGPRIAEEAAVRAARYLAFVRLLEEATGSESS